MVKTKPVLPANALIPTLRAVMVPAEQEPIIAEAERSAKMKRRLPITLVIVLLAGIAAFGFRRPLFGRFVCSIQNPEKTFQLDVYSYPGFFSMPGGGSDGPGFVHLKRLSDQTILETCDLEMVQMAYRPIWTSDNVEIQLIAEWRLER